jgi:hypothetical protein
MPSSVRELILNGFPPENVLTAYAVVGDSFDMMLALLVSGVVEGDDGHEADHPRQAL